MTYGIEFVPGNVNVKQVVNYCQLAESKDIDFAWITNQIGRASCRERV